MEHACSRRGETNWRSTLGGQAKNLRATIPETGGRPSQVLAGNNPTTGKPPQSFNPNFADKPFRSRSLVQVLFFLVARVFGYVEAVLSYAEKALSYGRRPGQPSSSSLARRSASNPGGWTTESNNSRLLPVRL